MVFYGLLTQFSKGTTPCRSHLEKIYGAELVDAAIDRGYIEEIKRNSCDDPVYRLTSLGKEVRDR